MELLLSTFIYLSQWELISQRICLGKTVFCALGIKSCSNFLYIRVGLFKVFNETTGALVVSKYTYFPFSFRPFYLILRTVYMVRISQRNMDLSAWNLSEPGFN